MRRERGPFSPIFEAAIIAPCVHWPVFEMFISCISSPPSSLNSHTLPYGHPSTEDYYFFSYNSYTRSSQEDYKEQHQCRLRTKICHVSQMVNTTNQPTDSLATPTRRFLWVMQQEMVHNDPHSRQWSVWWAHISKELDSESELYVPWFGKGAPESFDLILILGI